MPKKINQKEEKRAKNEAFAKKHKKEGKQSKKEVKAAKTLANQLRWQQEYEKNANKLPTKQELIALAKQKRAG